MRRDLALLVSVAAETPTVGAGPLVLPGPVTRQERTVFAWVAAVVLITVLGGIVWWVIGREARRDPAGVPVVAVLPLETSSSDPLDATLGLGVGDALVSDLAGTKGIVVVPSRARDGSKGRGFGCARRGPRPGSRICRRRGCAGRRRPGADQRARDAIRRHGAPRHHGAGCADRSPAAPAKRRGLPDRRFCSQSQPTGTRARHERSNDPRRDAADVFRSTRAARAPGSRRQRVARHQSPAAHGGGRSALCAGARRSV